MSRTRGILFPVLLYLLSLCSADYTWYDCGPPLTKAIDYQSISMYPSTFDVNNDLSLNIQAYIVREIQPFTTTTIQVFRDGELYVNSTIQDLCSILASNSISCPYDQDKISFTYQIDQASMPLIPGGEYSLQITNVLDGDEIACLAISGTVDGVGSSCTYTSTFQANLEGVFNYKEQAHPTLRTEGDWIQVGPSGPSPNVVPWGTITNFGDSTLDMIPDITPASLVWGISGTLTNITNNTNDGVITHTYAGYFVVSSINGSTVAQVYSGEFTLTDDIHLDGVPRDEVFSGEFTLTPAYSYFSQLTYPLVLGNLGSLSFAQNEGAYSYYVQAQQEWCSCPTDACSVCGGDGSSCNLGTLRTVAQQLPSRAIAAIVVSVFGVVILVVLINLYVKRHRFIRPINDDMDLLDPQKPDYGTMAINEIMNESPEDEE